MKNQERRLELMPLAKIQGAKRNPKTHDDGAITDSVNRFGFAEAPMFDERTGRLVAGHGRVAALRALKKAGKPPPAGVVRKGGEWLVPVQRGWKSKNDTEAEGYLIASNRTTEIGGWDDAVLAKMLESFSDDQLLGVGFSPGSIDAMLQSLRDVESETGVSLSDRFIIPPFSVLDARQGYWQERKREWLSLGIESEVGRGENLLKYSDTVQLRKNQRKSMGVYTAKHGTLKRGTTGPADRLVSPGGKQTGTSVFDPVLCELIYRWFGKDGFRALDPFAGGSVRGIVAAKLGLSYHGIELRPEQVEANKEQAEKILIDKDGECIWVAGDSYVMLDKLQPESFDLLIGCPPYMDLEVYSEDPKDLSAMTPEAFAGIYGAIIAKSVSKLRDNRFAVFVVGEVRDHSASGFYRGFVPMTIAAFESAGARFYNEAILVTAIGSLSMRVGSFFPRQRKLGKTHQNVLVFFKGDPSRIVHEFGELVIPSEALSLAEETQETEEPEEAEASGEESKYGVEMP